MVISDDMDMKAISAEYSRETALELALNAGNDIILIANNLIYDQDIASRTQEIILGSGHRRAHQRQARQPEPAIASWI